MSSRLRFVAALLCIPLLAAACGGGDSEDGGDTGGGSASAPAESPTSETAGQVLLEEDFESGAGSFQTATDATYVLEATQGVFSFFIAGLGNDANVIRSLAPLSEPSDAIAIESEFNFTQTYGIGVGGWRVRCLVGENGYLFSYDITTEDPEDVTYTAIYEIVDGQLDEIAREPTPDGGLGSDGFATFRAECRGTGDDGPVELAYYLDDQEIVSGTSQSGVGGSFDTVGIGGEWNGEKIGAGEGAMPGGLYFSADNVTVTGL